MYIKVRERDHEREIMRTAVYPVKLKITHCPYANDSSKVFIVMHQSDTDKISIVVDPYATGVYIMSDQGKTIDTICNGLPSSKGKDAPVVEEAVAINRENH